jgi:hypothetical protein
MLVKLDLLRQGKLRVGKEVALKRLALHGLDNRRGRNPLMDVQRDVFNVK